MPSDPIRLVHWNIKELDSTKVEAFQRVQATPEAARSELDDRLIEKAEQLEAAVEVLKKLDASLLSLNEVQYDTDKRDTAEAVSLCDFSQLSSERKQSDTVQNHEFLLKLIAKDRTWHSTFCPANTGNRALRDGNSYLQERPFDKDPDFARKESLLDKVNFGWTPGQYSTLFASQYPIEKRLNIAQLSWFEWDPDFDIKRFDLGFAPINYRDRNLSPGEIEILAEEASRLNENYKQYPLFDKNFNVSWLRIDDRPLAVITLHTVPAFGFEREGKSINPNPERNRAQLEFLEWFLFGSREPHSSSAVRRYETEWRPLPPSIPFIVAGDLNVAVESDAYPGARVMRRILSHPRVANSRLKNRIFGLSIIPDAHLPVEVLQGIQSGTYRSANFGGFNPYTTFIPTGFDYRGRGRGRTEQLDYIIASDGLDILRFETVFAQPDFRDFGWFKNAEEAQALIAVEKAKGRYVELARRELRDISGQNTFSEEICIKSVSSAYGALRKGSDHLPLLLEFAFKK